MGLRFYGRETNNSLQFSNGYKFFRALYLDPIHVPPYGKLLRKSGLKKER
jgi:hypothetical protein